MNLTGCQQGRMGIRDSWGVWNQHVHTATFKIDNQQGPTAWHRELCSMLYGLIGGGGKSGGERMHVYVWLSLFAVQLKLSQHC